MEIISFLKYVNRLKTPTPTPFPFRSHEKTDIMSKEMTDYIKKSNEESIQRMLSKYTTNFNGLLPIRLSDKFSLTPFFSRGNNNEKYLLYLGLFTGSCLFLLWKRQK